MLEPHTAPIVEEPQPAKVVKETKPTTIERTIKPTISRKTLPAAEKEEKIETTQKKIMKGMRFFDTPGESISTNAFEVDEMIDDHYAIARELR